MDVGVIAKKLVFTVNVQDVNMVISRSQMRKQIENPGRSKKKNGKVVRKRKSRRKAKI